MHSTQCCIFIFSSSPPGLFCNNNWCLSRLAGASVCSAQRRDTCLTFWQRLQEQTGLHHFMYKVVRRGKLGFAAQFTTFCFLDVDLVLSFVLTYCISENCDLNEHLATKPTAVLPAAAGDSSADPDSRCVDSQRRVEEVKESIRNWSLSRACARQWDRSADWSHSLESFTTVYVHEESTHGFTW